MKLIIRECLTLLFTACLLTTLTACIDFDSDSDSSASNSSRGTNDLRIAAENVEEIPIHAIGIKGPLAFADAKIYAFDPSFPDFYDKNAPISSAISSQFAEIDGLSVPRKLEPPYILTVGGDSAIDLNSGRAPVISTLVTVITGDMLSEIGPVHATPLTTLVFHMARHAAGESADASNFTQQIKDASNQVSATFAISEDVNIDVFESPVVINDTTVTESEQEEAFHHRAALEAFAAKIYELSLTLENTSPDALIERLARDVQSDGVIDNMADGETIGGIDPAILNQDPMKLPIPNTDYLIENIVELMEEERTLILTDKGPRLQVAAIEFRTQQASNMGASTVSGSDPTVTTNPIVKNDSVAIPDPIVITDSVVTSDPIVNTNPIVITDPIITLESFPVDLVGTPPQAASLTINVSKPSGVVNGVITLTTYDADFPDEGELVINNNDPIALFGTSGVSGNNQNSADISIITPASYWKNGENTLLFRHTRTSGFIIDSATVSFASNLENPSEIGYSDNMDNLGNALLITGGLLASGSSAADYVFRADFENRVANTTYSTEQLIEDFNANKNDGVPHGPDGGYTRIVRDPAGTERGNVLQVLHPAGGYKGGVNFKARFAPDNRNKKGSARFDDVYFAYDLYLSPNYKPMAMHKLPGMITGTLLEASHTYQQYNGQGIPPEGIKSFTALMQSYSSGTYPARPYGGALSLYYYDAEKTARNDFLDVINPTQKDPENSFTMPIGQWFTIEQRIKLNTADAVDTYNSSKDLKDGLAEVWINGVKMSSKVHLWRHTNTMKVDGIWFLSYYNNTSTTRSIGQTPPNNDQYEYYDNIRVSTSPITHR